jgi:hypothetical protein
MESVIPFMKDKIYPRRHPLFRFSSPEAKKILFSGKILLVFQKIPTTGLFAGVF